MKHYIKSLHYENERWKNKEHDSSFDVTIGSHDGTEICESIGIYTFSLYWKAPGKKIK